MKKDKMSFHIRFNNADPRHRKAARILNMVDRQKATIVANALWEYDLEDSFDYELANKSPAKNITVKPKTTSKPKITSVHSGESNTQKNETPDKENNGLVNSIVATLGQFQE